MSSNDGNQSCNASKTAIFSTSVKVTLVLAFADTENVPAAARPESLSSRHFNNVAASAAVNATIPCRVRTFRPR